MGLVIIVVRQTPRQQAGLAVATVVGRSLVPTDLLEEMIVVLFVALSVVVEPGVDPA